MRLRRRSRVRSARVLKRASRVGFFAAGIYGLTDIIARNYIRASIYSNGKTAKVKTAKLDEARGRRAKRKVNYKKS
jgi:hypothetical protein